MSPAGAISWSARRLLTAALLLPLAADAHRGGLDMGKRHIDVGFARSCSGNMQDGFTVGASMMEHWGLEECSDPPTYEAVQIPSLPPHALQGCYPGPADEAEFLTYSKQFFQWQTMQTSEIVMIETAKQIPAGYNGKYTCRERTSNVDIMEFADTTYDSSEHVAMRNVAHYAAVATYPSHCSKNKRVNQVVTIFSDIPIDCQDIYDNTQLLVVDNGWQSYPATAVLKKRTPNSYQARNYDDFLG